MKTFRFKGKGGKFNSKGAKYKRFMWKKNKFKSQYGPSNANNANDDDEDCNLNLIGNIDLKQQKQQKSYFFFITSILLIYAFLFVINELVLTVYVIY